MKFRIWQISLLLILVSAFSVVVPAQNEATYQKALSDAHQQSNPSQHRGRALVDYYNSFKSGGQTDEEALRLTMQKMNELAAIDFYAVYLALMDLRLSNDVVKKMIVMLPADQQAAIKRMAQLTSDNFKLTQSGQPVTTLPEHLYKPGYGWGKTVSSNAPKGANPVQSSQTAGTRAMTIDDYFNLGKQQSAQKDYDGAIRSYSECIKLDPKESACYHNRGSAYRNKGDFDAAIADLTQAIKLKPGSESAYILRALAYNGKKEYEMSIADYEAALKINPDNEAVKKALDAAKKLVAATKSFEEAKKNYVAEEEKQTKISEDFMKMGNGQMALKEYDAAIVAYTKCIEASPMFLECYNNRALAYGVKKNYDAAILDYTTILLFKQLPKIYYLRALNYRDKNDLDLAIKDFTKAIELAPEDSSLYMERGGTYYYKKDYNAAVADLNQAIKMKPQEAKYYFIRGVVYKDSGNTASATADFKKALELKPDFAAAKEQLQKLGVQL